MGQRGPEGTRGSLRPAAGRARRWPAAALVAAALAAAPGFVAAASSAAPTATGTPASGARPPRAAAIPKTSASALSALAAKPGPAATALQKILDLPPACPDADGDGWALCDDSCQPADGVQCGDCDDHDATVSPAALEVCDGRDNDCDGMIDATPARCQVGLGQCQVEGERTCAPGDSIPACHAVPGVPSAEICDGRDNDCDGRVDNGLPGCAPSPIEAACDCDVGADATYRNLCDAFAAGCRDLCVAAGTYTIGQDCTMPFFTSLTGIDGADSTVLVGTVADPLTIQGFTIEGSITSDLGGVAIFDNRVHGAVTITPNGACGFDCGTIAHNIIDGSITWQEGGLIRENVIGGGIFRAGRFGLTRIVGNDIAGAAVGIRAIVGAIIEDNRISDCGIGIQILPGQFFTVAVVTGNQVAGGARGIEVTPSFTARIDVAANDLGALTDAGVVVAHSDAMTVQIVGNVIQPRLGLPAGEAPGAGLRLDGAALVVENTISGAGVGVDLGAYPGIHGVRGTVDFRSNIVSDSAAAGVRTAGLPIAAATNDVAGNRPDWLGAPDAAGRNGNIDADPRFADAANGDLTLDASSPCLDAGAFGVRPVDTLGRPRVMDADMDGRMMEDIGAFELPPEVEGLVATLGPPETLEWEPDQFAAEGYDVYRGTLSDMARDRRLDLESKACGRAQTRYLITDHVPEGDGYIYLVVPRNKVSGLLRSDIDGTAPHIDDVCP